VEQAIYVVIPFVETQEHNDLRQTLFNQARSASICSPTNHIDIFDESILVFNNFHEALDFLINIFRSAAKMQNRSNVNISLKSSICHGIYFVHQDQIYGEAVNLATKLCFTSRENELQICGMDKQIVKTFIEEQEDIACFIREQDHNCISLGLRDPDVTQNEVAEAIIQIKHKNRLMDIQKSRHMEIIIGRENDADIKIEGPHISRSHATLTIRGDSLVIADHSANGTYLYCDGREIFLTENSLKLKGDGFISCGVVRQVDRESPDIIAYRHL
jgi:hypothetical protein